MGRETQLYRHYAEDGALLYVGISLSAVARTKQHSKVAEWYNQIKHVTIETFPSRRTAQNAETIAILVENPIHNIKRPGKVSLDLLAGVKWKPNEFLADYTENTYSTEVSAHIAFLIARQNVEPNCEGSKWIAKQAEHRKTSIEDWIYNAVTQYV